MAPVPVARGRSSQDDDSFWGVDRAPARPVTPLGTGTVSAHALQHPPSKKDDKILRKAQAYAESGDHGKAIEILRAAIEDSRASAYLHSRLGTEFLKCARPDLASPELEAAVRLIPGEPAHH